MTIRYRDLTPYKYQLLETYERYVAIHPRGPDIHTDLLSLSREGVLTVRRGYSWDGPSGPAIDTRNFMRGSLVHDAIYQLIRMGLLPADKRGAADRLLWRICLEDGMSWARAGWVYSSVRAMGWTACRPRKSDAAQVLEAP